MLEDANVSNAKDVDGKQLVSEVEKRKKLQNICDKIHAAVNLDEILVGLIDEIAHFFKAERLTIYLVDGKKQELVSRHKIGDEIEEIRIPISSSSISGYAALKKKILNLKNAYNDDELATIDSDLKHDKRWDEKFGFTTKQVLVVPVLFKQKIVFGAIQLMNRKNGNSFTAMDEQQAAELAKSLGIALYNQKRIAKTRPNKFDYFLENHVLTQKELDKAIADSRKTRLPVENVLMADFQISKQDIGKALSKFYNLPFVAYNSNLPTPRDLLEGLNVPFMRNYVWVPFSMEDGKIVILIDNPHDLQKVGEIKSLFSGKPITFKVSLKQDILDYIKLFTQAQTEQVSRDEIMTQLRTEDGEDFDDDFSLHDTELYDQQSTVAKLVNTMIIDAYNRKASDIHIEPYFGQAAQVRIRVDGSCREFDTIPKKSWRKVVSRIKIMAGLDIAERRKPQDGKIDFKKFGGLDIELRVATVPTQGGIEDIVMRILAAGEPIPLDQMGFSTRNYENFLSAVTQPYGIIFLCGPTGSGKTTTLHSALGYINKAERKIWTAEDPVEITQRRLRQVQVKPIIGYDFAAAMRAFLRADPDVIMVGEMRDKETTSIGIEASLTGHLVLSTLHTNSAPESITRLLDIGMDPFNFADAILCILAQRLVRTLCKNCKEAYHPSKTEYDELVREYGSEELFNKHVNIPYTDDLTLNRAKGCDECNNTGYAGRMGLHELLMGTDTMKKLIQTSANMEVLRDQAIKEGMTTLKQDGIAKIFSGNCDLFEVRKVTIK
ncbi:MAG: GspE/PulE family protein [Desulfobacterales bacterium]|nr:MAG: GspE/PulE family protein [Desulfobacterales bacterium]